MMIRPIRKCTNRLTKTAIEKISLEKIWVSKSSKTHDLSEFVKQLRPVSNGRGLKRFGPPGDGGYLLPDDLEGVVACISPGVATESGFDHEVADRGIEVYMADASVDGPAIHHEKFHFLNKHLDVFNSSKTITIDDFCKKILPRNNANADLILQMDIEGAEYSIILNMREETLNRFRIMVIEFHDLHQIFSKFSFSLIKSVFSRLTKNHKIVHIHPNNVIAPYKKNGLAVPPIMEFTFYRTDRDTFGGEPLIFPHPLDADNVKDRPPVILPKCWQ